MLSLLIRDAATIADAIGVASRYMFLHSPSYEVAIVDLPDGDPAKSVAIRFDVRHEKAIPQRQLVDGCLAALYGVTTRLTNRPFSVRCISLPHSPTGAPASYRDHFNADIRFAQPFAEIHIEPGVLNIPISALEADLHRRARAHIAEIAGDIDTSVAERVRRVIKSMLGSRRVTKAEVASALGVHPRTLQRRLAAEHTSFEQLLVEVQASATQRLLRETSIPLAQVAATLGYSEQSAMNRFIRRHLGTTPRTVREESNVRSTGELAKTGTKLPPRKAPAL